ncbi:gamma subclass chorismate mutase AroQ [Cnuibacter physcomitrellae]|uniref:gamma subclass chorismate mutase AroQ n=1 Tax=Cnuibacter physcomitrellae TaxID=1619308 RepID=UPI0021760BF4|nr:gamma subclass chorismate mutase AroQ [Cnuibacter physcomitrellae]MCS5495663.1 gamma subclass chorismate mutase AroQ [Cnuibacter physcomitrellae]
MPHHTLRRIAATALVAVASVGFAGCATPAPVASETTTPNATATAPAGSSPASAVPGGTFDAVVGLIVERLDTAPQVAASKLFTGQPVTDPAREQVVLDAAAAAAQLAGADTDYVQAVFADQIGASKLVQQSLLDQWAAGSAPAPTTAPDLATEVRPVLDRITAELVPALAAVQQYRSDPGCGGAVAASTASATAAAPVSVPEVAAALPTATAHLCS